MFNDYIERDSEMVEASASNATASARAAETPCADCPKKARLGSDCQSTMVTPAVTGQSSIAMKILSFFREFSDGKSRMHQLRYSSCMR